VKAVRGMIDTLQQRHDLRGRRHRNDESMPQEPEDGADEEQAAPEQAALKWNE
jgi:hypothetical protein